MPNVYKIGKYLLHICLNIFHFFILVWLHSQPSLMINITVTRIGYKLLVFTYILCTKSNTSHF